MKLIVRNDQPVLVWKVTYVGYKNGFDLTIFVEGTEEEMKDYLESEVGYVGKYRALSDSKIECVSSLGIKIYTAPQIGG